MDNRVRRVSRMPAAVALLAVASVMSVVLAGSFGGAARKLAAGPASAVGDDRVVEVMPASALVVVDDPVGVSPGQADRGPGIASEVQAGRPGWAGDAEAPQQQAPTLVEEQGFEDANFPPEGWEIFDNISDTSGAGSVNGWSRQICQAWAGDASAWSVGGGSQGSQLTCGGGFTQAQDNELRYTHIDASNFPEGLQVDFRFWVDWRVQDQGDVINNGFLACVRAVPGTDGNCVYFRDTPENPTPRKRWLGPSAPLVFKQAANRPDAEVFFRFMDTAPDGAHSGVFIDNVVISGLAEAPTTTPTTVAPTATRTPTRTATPGPSLTPTPRPASIIHLPMAMKDADKDDPAMFPPPVASSATVEFGIEVQEDGTVVGKATQFQFGIMRLCSKMSWFGFTAGTQMRWQWYQWDGSAFAEIPGALNGTIDAGEADWVRRCAASQQNGVPVPIPVNRYKVAVFVGDSSEPIGSGIAEVLDGPVPGQPTYTPTWTPQPTIAASVTPTAKPGESTRCEQPFENGDFERGPSVGWTLETNATQTDISRVIVRGSTIDPNFPVPGGEWLAVLGGGVNVRDGLYTPLWDLPEASTIISATLTYYMGISTEETVNGTNDDIVAPLFLNQDNERIQVPDSGISEENVTHDRWYRFRHDVTQLMTQRDGWNRARLIFVSSNSAAVPSVHLLDEVRLEMCVRTGGAGQARRTSRAAAGAELWNEPTAVLPRDAALGVAPPAAGRMQRVPWPRTGGSRAPAGATTTSEHWRVMPK